MSVAPPVRPVRFSVERIHARDAYGSAITLALLLLAWGTLGLVFTEKSSGKKFTYYTDCKRVPHEAVDLAKGSELVVLDGLRPQPHPSHMSIDEAVAVAQEIAAPKTYLTHLTHLTDHVAGQAALPPSVAFAYDGLRVTL